MVISKLLESLVISLALSSVPLTAVSQERLNWNWYYFCLGIGIFLELALVGFISVSEINLL